jgi:leucine dehydrogenase
VELWSSEQVVLCSDPATGLRAVIAIDNTTRGPALGGTRYKAYPTDAAAITEAQRLGAAMTLKHAAADLPYGGGKSVIIDGGPVADRAALMQAFGRFVERLGGTYIAAVDMGTSVADLVEVARTTSSVACDDEDPSPETALGVYAAIRAAVEHVDGTSLEGKRVLVQGVGHVGASLAQLLAADGAQVLAADVDVKRAASVAAAVGGSVVESGDVVAVSCDVFAPCAVARMLDPASIARAGARIVAGASNDTLADASCANLLAQRGITYVPDFVANAGGVIKIHGQRSAWDDARLRSELLAIGDRVTGLLDDATVSGGTPLDAAMALVRRRLERAAAA